MAPTKNSLSNPLQEILRFLFKKIRNFPLQPSPRIWKVIAYLFSRLCFWRKHHVEDDKKPSMKIDGPEKSTTQSNLGTVECLQDSIGIRPQERTDYLDHPPQASITLAQDVAYSLFPYASGGIPNASQSSQNLQKSLAAHGSRNSIGSTHSTTGLGYTTTPDPASKTAPTITLRQPTLLIPPTRTSSSGLSILPDQNAIEMEPITMESPQDINQNMLFAETSSRRSSSSNISTLPSASSRSSSPSPRNEENLNGPSISIPDRVRLNNDNIVPAMPEASTRYNNKPRIKNTYLEVPIPALTTDYNSPVPPSSWTRFVHPEGTRYFLKQTDNMDMKIWTESDIFNHKIREQLESDIRIIEQFICDNEVSIPAQSDMVVDFSADGLTVYYFANHSTRTIFFLDDYQAENLGVWWEVPGAESLCHIRYAIEAQYWYFILLFPHALNVTRPMVQDLRGSMLHYIGDSTTSMTSTAPCSLDDLYKVLTLIDHLDENVNIQNVGAASLLGRIMFIVAREGFLNFHGEAHSRLERTFSVYGDDTYPRRWLVRSLASLLFYAPDSHLINLQKMRVDKIMRSAVFEDLSAKINDEWQQCVLFATVMLNANVAFLAIQSVDNNDSNDPHRSPAQICSYLSVVASMGSILLGLLLSRDFRARDREAVPKTQYFLFSGNDSALGLETLAILFSLPYALLMWGMVAFLAGFASLCFKTSDLPTRSIVGSSFLVVAALVLLCIQWTWATRQSSQVHTYKSDEALEEHVEASSFIRQSLQSVRRIPSLLHSSPETNVNPV